MGEIAFPKKVLARINKIRVPEAKMKKIEYDYNKSSPHDSGFIPTAGYSIHEFLKFKIMELGERLGYFPYPEFYLSRIRGTIEYGSVDVMWVDIKKGKPPHLSFAFEIERGFPSEKTLLKLKHLKNLVKYRAVLMYSSDPSFHFFPIDGNYIRKFMKDGIAVIGNWPTLTELLFEFMQNCKAWLETEKKRLKNQTREVRITDMQMLEITLGKRPKEKSPEELRLCYDLQLDKLEKIFKKIKNKKDKNKRFCLMSEKYLGLAEQINDECTLVDFSKIANFVLKKKEVAL